MSLTEKLKEGWRRKNTVSAPGVAPSTGAVQREKDEKLRQAEARRAQTERNMWAYRQERERNAAELGRRMDEAYAENYQIPKHQRDISQLRMRRDAERQIEAERERNEQIGLIPAAGQAIAHHGRTIGRTIGSKAKEMAERSALNIGAAARESLDKRAALKAAPVRATGQPTGRTRGNQSLGFGIGGGLDPMLLGSGPARGRGGSRNERSEGNIGIAGIGGGNILDPFPATPAPRTSSYAGAPAPRTGGRIVYRPGTPLQCSVCGWQWQLRGTKKPKVCPHCKSYSWSKGTSKARLPPSQQGPAFDPLDPFSGGGMFSF